MKSPKNKRQKYANIGYHYLKMSIGNFKSLPPFFTIYCVI